MSVVSVLVELAGSYRRGNQGMQLVQALAAVVAELAGKGLLMRQ